MRLDPVSVSTYKAKNIHAICVHIVAGGCNGSKISISEGVPIDTSSYVLHQSQDMHYYISTKDYTYLQDTYITYTNGKYILAGDTVNTRCGCGKSISFKTGNTLRDKAEILRDKLKGKKVVHTI
jgi:Fe-S cluster assembly iron-binding protein IscA